MSSDLSNAGAVPRLRGGLRRDALNSENLKSKAVRGAYWTVLGFGANQLFRITSNLILCRLLVPEAFGLMSLVSVFLQGLKMCSDVGISPSIVQSEHGDNPAFLKTAWTIQVGRGFALWMGAIALAWPLSRVYDPSLLVLLPVVGITAFINGFNSTALYSLRRHIQVIPGVVFDVLSQVLSLTIMVLWAIFVQRDVWALVVGAIVGALVKLILSFVLFPTPFAHRLYWDREAAKALFRFGRWIFLSTVFAFLMHHGDRLLLGVYMPMSVLGVYSIAVTFSRLIQKVAGRLRQFVLLPVFSHIARERAAEQLRESLYRVRWRMDFAFLPPAAFMLMTGETVIHTLYDVRYHEAGWMLQLLVIRATIAYILSPAQSALVALGKPNYHFFANLARAAWIFLGIPLGYQLAGIHGVVWAVATSELPAIVVVWAGLIRNRVFSFLKELRGVAIYGLGLPLGWLANYVADLWQVQQWFN